MQKVKINVPTSWADITIRQFTEITRIKESNLDSIEKTIEIIAVATGTDREVIARISIDKLKDIYRRIAFVAAKEIQAQEVTESVKIDGVEYVANLDIRKASAGQYIDLKEITKKPGEINFRIHEVMAIFFLPKGEQYNGETMLDRAELFYEKMSIALAYPVAVFFLKI
jgi:hypothetical protein